MLREWFIGLGLALFLTWTRGPGEPVTEFYPSLSAVHWKIDEAAVHVLPLISPGFSWNPHGRVAGTLAEVAVSYHNIQTNPSPGQVFANDTMVQQTLPRQWHLSDTQFPPGDLEEWAWHAITNLEELHVSLPWITNRIAWTDWYSLHKVHITARTDTDPLSRRHLWQLEMTNLPRWRELTVEANVGATIAINSAGSVYIDLMQEVANSSAVLDVETTLWHFDQAGTVRMGTETSRCSKPLVAVAKANVMVFDQATADTSQLCVTVAAAKRCYNVATGTAKVCPSQGCDTATCLNP